jgi:ATP-dependent exoDNAse (exonuclease V) alpha subunit
MARTSTASSTEVLAGLVDRVTFHNSENGFCVLRVKARGQRDLITVIGHAAMISAGEFIQASGSWINDRTHGVQFRASFLKATAPTTVEGIQKYLGSGMIRGIGPVYAKKLVRAFGEAVFDVIQQEPSRLREVTGIGPKRAERIIAGWAEQKVIREIMLFLHSNGVGTSRAVRIYKTYGAGKASYSHVVRVSGSGKIVYTAGQLARDVDGSPLRSSSQWTLSGREMDSNSRFLVRTTGEKSQTSRTTLPPSDGNPVRGLDGFVARRRHRSPSTDRSGSPPGRDRPDSITQAARLIRSRRRVR